MFVVPRKLKGLRLLKSSWKVHLQHFAIANRLSNVEDDLFHKVYDCSDEISTSITSLGVNSDSTKALRQALGLTCYEKWCNLKYQGGVPGYVSSHTISRKCNIETESVARVTGSGSNAYLEQYWRTKAFRVLKKST